MKLDNIHEDNRGAIMALTGDLKDYPEIAILKTNENYARGGCIHRKHIEHLCVFEGHIKYVYRFPNETEIQEAYLGPGEGISIPANTPHYYISLSDSIVGEWGCDLDEKQEKHEEFRKIVLDYNNGR